MSDVAIRVENLGKRYRIGQREAYKTLRDVLTNAFTAPFRRRRKENLPTSQSTFRDPKSDYIWALKDVSFEIKQGEVLGIIGGNGAGKSTLLKILSRTTEPTEGYAEINGRVGSLLEVGTGFHPELTGRENIYLNAAILGMKRREIDCKFDEIVAFAEIEKFLDTPVKHYSSGMYVRLAFAVAAHLEPEILVVDEVLAVGDAQFQKKCLGKMGEVVHEGRTVLFVSHNMNAIEQLCNRVILLENGNLKMGSNDTRSIINSYLFSGQEETSLDAEWVNSRDEFENDWFKPLRLVVVDKNGNRVKLPINNAEEVYFQIEAEIKILDPSLTIGYAVYSNAGSTLFWSYQTDGAETEWPVLEKGINVLRGQIPKRLLNEGNYRIELIGGLHYRIWLFEPGKTVPGLILRIQGGLSDSPYWMSKRPGEFAPVIEWKKMTSKGLSNAEKND